MSEAKDCLVRALSADGFVKASAVTTRNLVERARQIHKTLPVATAALGRALSAASMMGNAMKEDAASVTIQFKGGGPLGTLLAVSDHEGNVRGYAENPGVDLPLRPDGKLDVGGAVGCDGTLTIIRDLRMKEPYTGSIGLLSGEIAEDIAAYFAESEQIPTVCALGVLVERDQSVLAAGGTLIQLLPGAPDDIISRVERGVMALGPVTTALRENPDPAELLKKALPDFELQILERSPIAYRCDCSRRRMEAALIALGRVEMRKLIEEQGEAELSCRFCGAVRRFTREDLEALLERM
ncbi:MAG: Hsp33 family molecular chaperone HslO [Oscillibacter sp.]|nr:Hsp33 family molecular chaperone HslO [Oscillibacter sp.]